MEAVLGEIGRCPAQDLVFLLEAAVVPAQLAHLGLLVAAGALTLALIYLVLAHPAKQRGLRDPDVLGDLTLGHLALQRHGHHVGLELRRVVLVHLDILP